MAAKCSWPDWWDCPNSGRVEVLRTQRMMSSDSPQGLPLELLSRWCKAWNSNWLPVLPVFRSFCRRILLSLWYFPWSRVRCRKTQIFYFWLFHTNRSTVRLYSCLGSKTLRLCSFACSQWSSYMLNMPPWQTSVRSCSSLSFGLSMWADPLYLCNLQQ